MNLIRNSLSKAKVKTTNLTRLSVSAFSTSLFLFSVLQTHFKRWGLILSCSDGHSLQPYISPSSPPDQDGELMWPFEEEGSVCSPKPLLLQGHLPLPRVWAGRGAEEEKGAGLPQPDRQLPQIFQGGLHGLDIRCTDSLLAVWWVDPKRFTVLLKWMNWSSSIL